MPRKAFLKKKSLLDRFKDDYATHTGYIQSARAKHTWNNPLTRRKRTKELNKWIKSFAGKDHIHKLARFNATNAGRYESMYDEAMSLKGFLENLTEKLTKQFDLDLEEVQAYLNSHTQEMQELLNDTELSLKEKVLFVRSEITGEQDEKKSEKLVVSNPCVVYKGDAENAAKAHDYLYKKMPRVKGASISSDVKPLGNNKFCRVLFYGNNTGVMDLFGYYSNLYNDDFWNNCDADPQGWVDPLTINRYDVATPRQESKKSEFYMDGDDSEDYYYCHRCGRVTPSYELDAHGGFCSDCDARWTAEHENESKDTDEKLGYEKGHKNSKGEDAPWVIRSHEDNRVLASFANEDDAKEHLKRMKQYSKKESKQSEAHDLKNYTSDIISKLDGMWACGLNGAKRLAEKYADVIQQNYTDGDLSTAETAKFIAGQENLTESRKKSESKKSEVHLELIDTIIVPKWLWEAHTLGNEYGEDLDEHEQEILAKFEEEYGKQYYLDDRSEEADFRSRNDFDEYGGPCYEVDVYKMS